MTGGEKPNWEKWRQVPDVRLWEGIALSLDIEPDPSDLGDANEMAQFMVSRESKEFGERLFVATRRLSSKGDLRLNSGEPSRSMVRLSQFAIWVLSLGWKVPPAFADLAPRPSGTESRGNTERSLEGKARATALKLILGMAIQAYRYDPKAKRSSSPKQIADDLQRSGIALTDETVRQWLQVAAQEVEWESPAE